MKFKIGQEVKSVNNNENRYTVIREIDRKNIRVRHVDSIGCGDLEFDCSKSSVVAA